MHQVRTQIDIDATFERVWSMLVGFELYSGWNPFIRSIEGSLEAGRQLTVIIEPAGSGAMRFRPTVLKVEPLREFRWQGKLMLRGLFDGEHYFKLEANPAGGVTFHQGELFSGILVPLFRRSLDGATQQGFIAMNKALKREAESADPHAPDRPPPGQSSLTSSTMST
jgi:hypothetical protein